MTNFFSDKHMAIIFHWYHHYTLIYAIPQCQDVHAFRCSVVVQFVNIIRSLRIVQWSNKLQLPPQIRNVGPFYNLFLFIHASRLCSPCFGPLGVISNELEREECSWVSTAFVLDFDTGNMTSFANKTHAIFHWRIDW